MPPRAAKLLDRPPPSEAVLPPPWDGRRLARSGIAGLVLLAVSHLVVDAYVSFLPPLWPLLIAKHNLSLTAVGVLTSLSTVAMLPVQPLAGYLTDRRNVSLLLWAGPAAAAIAMSTVLLPASLVGVVLLVLMGKVGNAVFHPPAARLVGMSTGGGSGLAMSVFVFGGNLGMALGPLAILAAVTWGGPRAAVLAVLPGLVLAVALRARQRPVPGVPSVAAPEHGGLVPETVGRPGTAFWLLILVMSIRAGVWGGVTTFLPVYLVQQGSSVLLGGMALAVFNLGGAACGLVAGALSDRVGRRPVVVGSLVLAAGALALFLRNTGPMSLAWLAVAGAGVLSSSPIGVVMAQELYPGRRALASGMSMGMAFGAGALLVTPLGRLADLAGTGAALWALAGVSLLAAALALLLPAGRGTGAAPPAGGQAPASAS